MKTIYGLPKKREEVIEELKIAFTNQNLDDAEYENRLNEALSAKSIEDLEMTVFDFPTEIKNKLFPKDATVQQIKSSYASNLPSMQVSDSYRIIMGEDNRQIQQLGEQTLNFLAVMSSQVLDFRKSQLEGNRFKLHIECLLGKTVIDLRNEDLANKHIDIWIGGGLGEIKILLPRGGSIRKEAQLFGGNFTMKDKRKSWLNRLTGNKNEETPQIQFSVNLHGNYWLGNVDIVY
jgi:Cell wall-active antibiotics response 4TMS YvqF